MADQHIHGDLGDQTPGYDQDFDYPHLDRDSDELPEGGRWITGNPIVHIMTEEEITKFPIINNGEEIDVF